LAVNLIDFFSYECYGVTDGARFTRWIVFLTLMILAYEVLEESMRLAKLGKDSEKMKSIAYNDALTCMGNRMAFMEKIKQIEKQNYKNYGVAMFDLNNLKVFNDVHGHSAGDYYLIISSEILQDIFGPYGNIYRIGGDEFCAILKGISEEEFELYAKEMYIRLSKLKGPYTTEEMSIAFGYKKYDEKYDRNLSSTTDRADACMYINKTKIKQRLKESILVG
ncbi:MAG: GGDEF domain-containing protein, partial [Acetivibrio sp.]